MIPSFAFCLSRLSSMNVSSTGTQLLCRLPQNCRQIHSLCAKRITAVASQITLSKMPGTDVRSHAAPGLCLIKEGMSPSAAGILFPPGAAKTPSRTPPLSASCSPYLPFSPVSACICSFSTGCIRPPTRFSGAVTGSRSRAATTSQI